MQRQTTIAKAQEISRKWYVIDATDKPLGRLASEVAVVLIGKHKPIFTPNVDCGDFVIVINAEKVRVTGDKLDQKMYYRHSQYPGGLKTISLRDQLKQHPDRVIRLAVRGMLPKNRLGRQMIKKLKVYAGPNHPHAAQRPVPFEIKQVAQ